MPEYLRLGKLVAAHGLKGEMVLEHFLGKKSSLRGLEAVFIEEKKNSYLPWFIQSVRIKNDSEVYLKLEGIDVREQAQRFTQKEVWVADEKFKKLAARSSPVNLLGYRLVQDKKPLGKILEVVEQPHQVLCRIEIKKKEVMIPLNEDTLKKIDHKKQEVIVQLPEGLMEIYL
jgi:16S rRNA processing protein RimM